MEFDKEPYRLICTTWSLYRLRLCQATYKSIFCVTPREYSNNTAVEISHFIPTPKDMSRIVLYYTSHIAHVSSTPPRPSASILIPPLIHTPIHNNRFPLRLMPPHKTLSIPLCPDHSTNTLQSASPQ